MTLMMMLKLMLMLLMMLMLLLMMLMMLLMTTVQRYETAMCATWRHLNPARTHCCRPC